MAARFHFLFSSFAMRAVGEAAFEMIEEVRRQFREIEGLLEGKPKLIMPDVWTLLLPLPSSG